MFADSFLFQLALFLVAHVAAFGNMRTGRILLGFLQFAGVWILLDFAIVQRFVAGERGAWFLVPLLGMQVIAVSSAVEWFWRRARTRRASFVEGADRRYAQALGHWMAGRDAEARAILRPMLRRDPWDAEARFLLGTIEHDAGQPQRAVRLLKDACFRTHEPLLKEEIREELRRVKEHMERVRATAAARGKQPTTKPAAPKAKAKASRAEKPRAEKPRAEKPRAEKPREGQLRAERTAASSPSVEAAPTLARPRSARQRDPS